MSVQPPYNLEDTEPLKPRIWQSLSRSRMQYGALWHDFQKYCVPACCFRSWVAFHHERSPPYWIFMRQLFVSASHEPENSFNNFTLRRAARRLAITRQLFYKPKINGKTHTCIV